MKYLRELIHDFKLAFGAGVNQFVYIRKHLRRGGNPDF